MPALALLLAALGVNYARHKTGRSTICSTLRPHVGPVAFCIGWGLLTGWLAPHYCRPFFRKEPRA